MHAVTTTVRQLLLKKDLRYAKAKKWDTLQKMLAIHGLQEILAIHA